MKDNIISVNGGRDPAFNQKLVDDMISKLSFTIQYYAIRAQVQRATYLALVKEGFTEQQALELTKGVL